jgi:hypothetical protein
MSAACTKKTPLPETQTTNVAPVAVTAVPAADKTEAQRELEEKQALMDYATMEDKYINDPRAQWASGAKASSTFGDEDGKTPADSSLAINMQGPVDSKEWTNNHQDMGFDTIELTYAKPATANEVRVVLRHGEGAEAISKVELQDTNGKWNTAWSGISEVKRDQRGGRTWFVRSFEKTAYKANAVKVTFANNLQRGYKDVNAVQLVGD